MIDMIVAVLTLCFVIGAISSALFVASFYLYRESHRASPTNHEGAAPPAAATASAAAAVVSGDVSATRPKVAAACAQENTSTSSCCSCSNNSDAASSCSYTCQVCGSCCAGDSKPDDLRHGQGDNQHELQQQLLKQQQQQQRPHYRCGEVFVSGVDVGFKCHGGGAHGGTFFFYRGRHPGELLEPVAPSDRYLTMAALPSVPYHLWFCHSEHPTKSRRCPNCRRVFSFELCDSEMLFHQHSHRRRHSPADAEGVRQLRGVWLLVCQEAEGRSSVVYRGDVGNVTSLTYAGKLLVHFGLPDKSAKRRRRGTASGGVGVEKLADGATTGAEATVNEYSAQGDLRIRAGLELVSSLADSSRQHKQPHQLQRLQHLAGGHRGRRRRGSNGENDGAESARDIDIDDMASDSEAELNTSTTNSLKSGNIQSPMSMGSMRKAAKWPITQIESLIESSSSDERQTAAMAEAEADNRTGTEQLPPANVGAAGNVGGANVSIQLDIGGKQSLGISETNG